MEPQSCRTSTVMRWLAGNLGCMFLVVCDTVENQQWGNDLVYNKQKMKICNMNVSHVDLNEEKTREREGTLSLQIIGKQDSCENNDQHGRFNADHHYSLEWSSVISAKHR